jgi:hypothetical protein
MPEAPDKEPSGPGPVTHYGPGPVPVGRTRSALRRPVRRGQPRSVSAAAPVSRRVFSRSRLAGISLRAWPRTTSGTRSFPMRWPVKSTAMVSRLRASLIGSTVRVDRGADRSVDAAHTPCMWRVDMGQHAGGGTIRAADPPGHVAPVADRGRLSGVHVSVDHTRLTGSGQTPEKSERPQQGGLAAPLGPSTARVSPPAISSLATLRSTRSPADTTRSRHPMLTAVNAVRSAVAAR